MNTAVLVTARLSSTRLPRKVIKPIMGRPMICHMLDRWKLARHPEKIIICTSTLPDDDPLAEIAERESVHCFRGHPDDVLLRLTMAAEQYGVDTVINCSGDNPFVDPEYMDRLVDWHVQHDYDYSRCDGLPLGVYAWALSYNAMVRACEIKATTDTEGWAGYFTDTGQFSCGLMPVDPEDYWPDLRLTVDTPEDFELITRIFEELYVPGEVFPLSAILNLCRSRPDLVEINSSIQQKPVRPIQLKQDVEEPELVMV